MSLEQNLQAFSPRYVRRHVPWASVVVHAAVLLLWLTAVAGAWLFTGVWAWSAGLAYVAYDTWLLVHVARRTAFVLRPAPPAVPRNPAGLRLAVVVAARNERSSLPETLDRLLADIAPGDRILIVDDGSSDGTAAMLAARYGVLAADAPLAWSVAHPALGVLRLSAGGKARALNAALARLDEAVVVTVDADTHVAPGALGAIRAAFADEPELVAACGVLTPTAADGAGAALFRWFQTYEYVRAFVSRIAWMRSGCLLLVSGAFAAFRREALCEVGGFDPQCLVEDYEVIHRLHRYGFERGVDWRVRVLAGARATTDVPGTLPAFLRQRRRWFAGFLQTQYWNRDMTANVRYGSLGRTMMPIKALDTLQPVYGITAFLLLVWFLASRNATVLLPVLAVIGAKIVVDLLFYLWWVRLYARWLGEPASTRRLAMAALAALLEPFSFQLLRHTGAVLGWWSFLRGRLEWGRTSRAVPN